jgi:hypothetical protein
MDENGHPTTSTYRLVDREGHVVDVHDFPTDAVALAWLEDARYHQSPGVWIRRVERKTGDDWVFVSPAGD